MKEKQVVSSWSFLVSLSHHGNRLLPPSCTPVYLVYSSPIHPSHPPTLFWPPSPTLAFWVLYPSLFAAFAPPLIIQITNISLVARHPTLSMARSEDVAISRISSKFLYVRPNLCLPGYTSSSYLPHSFIPPHLPILLMCIWICGWGFEVTSVPREEETKMDIYWKISDRKGKIERRDQTGEGKTCPSSF